MAIKIITDSTCDIDKELARQLDIEIAPLRVIFGEESYKDGVDLSNDEFYKKLESSKQLPTTSQVNPDEFEAAFSKQIKEGHSVLGIFISAQLSGTYQSAQIAKEAIGSNEIYLVDTKTATIGLGIFVRTAVKMRNEGKSIKEIHNELSALADKVKLVAVVNTLKYLKMGGRVSAATAIIGEALGISPIVTVTGGLVTPAGKVRGKKKAFSFIEDFIKANPINEDYPIGFASSTCKEEAIQLEEHLKALGIGKEGFQSVLGAVIGTHGGPGCYGVAYISK